MVTIRTAVEADIPTILTLGRLMHAESRYGRFDFSPVKCDALVRRVIPQGLTFVAEERDAIVGVFIGTVFEQMFGADLASCDIITYVPPERRGRIGLLLTKEYIRRAKALGVLDIRIGVSTGIDPERTGRFYEKLGFSHVGGVYAMEN